MKESNFQKIDVICESTHNKLISKNLVNYIFKKFVIYIGKQNSAIFFRKQKYQIDLIIIQEYFALNGQMKILKKWSLVNFKNIAFMHKSNEFVTSNKSKISINKIDCFYNLNIAEGILTYENELKNLFLQKKPQYKSFLILSKNEDLIVTSIQTTIYFLIKESNGNWKLQQKEKIGYDRNTFIKGYQLNDEGNTLIVSFQQSKSSILYLSVFLRVNGIWGMIKEISFRLPSQQFSFWENQKFLIFYNENEQAKLSIYQVFLKTFEVKLLQTQDFQISENFIKFKFFYLGSLLVAWRRPFVYLIEQVNTEFITSQQMSISQDLKLKDIINEQWLFFISSQFFGNIYKTQVQKLYGK